MPTITRQGKITFALRRALECTGECEHPLDFFYPASQIIHSSQILTKMSQDEGGSLEMSWLLINCVCPPCNGRTGLTAARKTHLLWTHHSDSY